MSKTRSEWTPMVLREAISFISATLGEPFSTAQGNSIYWSAFGVKQADGTMPYPVSLDNLGSKVKLTVSFMAANDGLHSTSMKLFAIVGWAAYHGHECEHD